MKHCPSYKEMRGWHLSCLESGDAYECPCEKYLRGKTLDGRFQVPMAGLCRVQISAMNPPAVMSVEKPHRRSPCLRCAMGPTLERQAPNLKPLRKPQSRQSSEHEDGPATKWKLGCGDLGNPNPNIKAL